MADATLNRLRIREEEIYTSFSLKKAGRIWYRFLKFLNMQIVKQILNKFETKKTNNMAILWVKYSKAGKKSIRVRK